jgi:hypothetical protein
MRSTLPNARSVSTCKVCFEAHFSCAPLLCGETDVYWGCSEFGAPLRPSRAAAGTVREIVTAARAKFIPFQEIFAVARLFAAGTRAEKERQHASMASAAPTLSPRQPASSARMFKTALALLFLLTAGLWLSSRGLLASNFLPHCTASSVTSACFGPRSSRI